MLKKIGMSFICFVIVFSLAISHGFASSYRDTISHTIMAYSTDYGLKGFAYKIDISEGWRQVGTKVELRHHYLSLYKYKWQNPLGGTAGLYNSKYYEASNVIGTLYPSDYSNPDEYIIPDYDHYFFGSNNSVFSQYFKNDTKMVVSTYFALDSSWIPQRVQNDDTIWLRR